MDNELITLDTTNVTQEAVGKYGLRPADFEALRRRGVPRTVVAEGAQRPGFVRLAEQSEQQLEEIVQRCQSFAASIGQPVRDFVVLGIGGSALGAIALRTALTHPFAHLLPEQGELGQRWEPPVRDDTPAPARPGPRVHIMDNVDPAQFYGLLQVVNPEQTLFCVISKSGKTAETVAQFAVVRAWLARAGIDWRSRVIVITDAPHPTDSAKDSILLKRARRPGEELLHFEIPRDVGGRFSVLSPVGLVPAVFMGIDIKQLVAGARAMYERCRNTELEDNPAWLLGGIYYLFWTLPPERHPRNINVLMPYSSALRDVADWFRQLWAESLGKRHDLDGKIVEVGQTPVKALGATDQHSQLQLYQEGPHDKIITFIEVQDYGCRCPIAEIDRDDPQYLAGASLAELLTREKQGTEFALTRSGRPNLTIRVPRVSPHTVGQLFFLFEMATAIVGELLYVNTYDQPGVLLCKLATRALMGERSPECAAVAREMGLEPAPQEEGAAQ